MADYDLTRPQLKRGYEICINNVQNLLDSAILLLGKENSHQYALGLYMYAIEEYGKAELLRDLLVQNKRKYSIPDWIFGRGRYARKGHVRKLSKAFKILPDNCRKLSRTIKITPKTSGNLQTIKIEKHGVLIGSISVPVYLSGTFEDRTLKKTVEFDLKTACFYVDWDNKGHWKYVLLADKHQLTSNIRLMKEVTTHRIS
jgi:AbiV family abortive infection protein